MHAISPRSSRIIPSMLIYSLHSALRSRPLSVCLRCCARGLALPPHSRLFTTSASLRNDTVQEVIKEAEKRRRQKAKEKAKVKEKETEKGKGKGKGKAKAKEKDKDKAKSKTKSKAKTKPTTQTRNGDQDAAQLELAQRTTHLLSLLGNGLPEDALGDGASKVRKILQAGKLQPTQHTTHVLSLLENVPPQDVVGDGASKVRKILQSGKIQPAQRTTHLPSLSENVPPEDDVENGASKVRKIRQGAKSLKEALLMVHDPKTPAKRGRKPVKAVAQNMFETLPIQEVAAKDLELEPVPHDIPPIPMLSHGLDRVLFNPGVYRLQDPRSRIYNFDPYLEKIMPATEFDFDALDEYQTSSKDQTLLDITRRLGTKFTGSTSSMSSALSQFHFLLSASRGLDNSQLSRAFPAPSENYSKISKGPSAIFLRWKDGIYAIDADKSFDTPNIMSWLGQSLEKLLTNTPSEFERFRKSNTEAAPTDDQSARCFHYSRLGNLLMRSQLDAHDPRLPGTGVFDLKTRAVVSIRMDHQNYEEGSGYQLRFDQGEWESYEREFYDMCRATLLKYSLQVRMGRMDGIFVAYHNIERIFGFQYLSLPDMDRVIHGQTDTTLGDQEFRLSVRLLDDILQRATEKFPKTSIRLHFITHDDTKAKLSKRTSDGPSGESKVSWMSIFAEPVTEEQVEEIQNAKSETYKIFERDHIGVRKDDPEMQAEWHNIQEVIDEEVDKSEEEISAEDGLQEAEKIERNEVEEVDGEETETDEKNVEGVDEIDAEGIDEVDAEGIDENDTDEKEVEETEQADSEGDADSEDHGGNPVPPNEEGSDNATEAAADKTGEQGPEISTPTEPISNGPLMGWTLAVRHRINGEYCERPMNLTSSDDWTIEYVVKEMEADAAWRNYEKTKKGRAELLAKDEEAKNKSLSRYRAEITRFTQKGRTWRELQDKIDEQIGQKVYKPLGPGSGTQDPVAKDV